MKIKNNLNWGLGIGDWAQSPFPIPKPQSPNPKFLKKLKQKIKKKIN